MTKHSFDRAELSVLKWAVQVALDAVMIQVNDGIYPEEVGKDIYKKLTIMESRLFDALAEDPQGAESYSQPTLF